MMRPLLSIFVTFFMKSNMSLTDLFPSSLVRPLSVRHTRNEKCPEGAYDSNFVQVGLLLRGNIKEKYQINISHVTLHKLGYKSKD